MIKNFDKIKAEFDHHADQFIASMLDLSPSICDSKPSLYDKLCNSFIERLMLTTIQHQACISIKAADKLGLTRLRFRAITRHLGINLKKYRKH